MAIGEPCASLMETLSGPHKYVKSWPMTVKKSSEGHYVAKKIVQLDTPRVSSSQYHRYWGHTKGGQDSVWGTYCGPY